MDRFFIQSVYNVALIWRVYSRLINEKMSGILVVMGSWLDTPNLQETRSILDNYSNYQA